MNNNLRLFARARDFVATKARIGSKKLHTWSIYPYPFNYINTQIWPSYHAYRENFHHAKWAYVEQKRSLFIHRFFWTYLFYLTWHHPEALWGHGQFPTGDTWTDAELGIPPDEEGSYKDWLANRMGRDAQD